MIFGPYSQKKLLREGVNDEAEQQNVEDGCKLIC
jgi:hypothetical protein